MFNLKPLERDCIPRALEKAERYRFLNEPREAESICLDILAIDPGNSAARITLILALTDSFAAFQVNAEDVRPLALELSTEYDRAYYGGVIEERWAKALMLAAYPRELILQTFRAALAHFGRAETLAPKSNDDAVLRWNSCVRLIERQGLEPFGDAAADSHSDAFEDDVPVR